MGAITKETINLTDEDIDIIEPIIERINGLEELLIIVPDQEFELKAKIAHELSCLKRDKDKWIIDLCKHKGCIYPNKYNIDIMDKIIIIINPI